MAAPPWRRRVYRVAVAAFIADAYEGQKQNAHDQRDSTAHG